MLTANRANVGPTLPNGSYDEREGELHGQDLGSLTTSEVGQVLQQAVQRIDAHLRQSGLLDESDPQGQGDDAQDNLAASAVSGQAPPAGPQWVRRLSQPRAAALGYDKPLCASLDGFSLHEPAPACDAAEDAAATARPKGSYWGWAQWLKRTFDVDVLQCTRCPGRMQRVALVAVGAPARGAS